MTPKSNITQKILIGVIILLLLLNGFLSYHVYQLRANIVKGIEAQITELNTKVDTLETKEANAVSNIKKSTKAAQIKNKTIDQKLKQDEKTIYNSVISDSTRRAFLAKHRDNARNARLHN